MLTWIIVFDGNELNSLHLVSFIYNVGYGQKDDKKDVIIIIIIIIIIITTTEEEGEEGGEREDCLELNERKYKGTDN